MSIKTERQAIDAITVRHKVVEQTGRTYTTFRAYLGTDPATGKKIIFERASKKECIDALRLFYASRNAGAPLVLARELSPSDLADIKLAKDALVEANLAGVTFFDIAREYISRHSAVERTLLVDAYRRYLGEFTELQERHAAAVKSRVGAFVNENKEKLVTDILPRDVTAHLSEHFGKAAPKTFNNHLSYIKTFFNWCKRGDIALCTENPAADIRPKAIHYEEPEFIDAEKLRRVFDVLTSQPQTSTRDQVIWFFAIWFFMGVRVDEIMRLRNKDVNIDEGWIRVATPKGFQHGVAPRMVEMHPVCKAWLLAYGADPDASDNSFITRFRYAHFARTFLIQSAARSGERGFSLVENAGRHSFITMHVAMFGDPRRTEALAGTSKDMRVNNYMGLATKKQAEDYFNVYPIVSVPAIASNE